MGFTVYGNRIRDDEYVLDEERNAFDAFMDQTPSNM